MIRRAGIFVTSPIPGLKTAVVLSACMLSACGESNVPAPQTDRGVITTSATAPVRMTGEQPGTPMKDRVAVLGFLNKQNGKTRDIELKPGQSIRIGRVFIRLRACEKTAPWETYPDAGAFVQLLVNASRSGQNSDRWNRVFSGWLFKENPAANVIEHPIYDIWVKDCKMRFPGDETDAPAPAGGGAVSKATSSAPQSPKPAPAEVSAPPAAAAAASTAE